MERNQLAEEMKQEETMAESEALIRDKMDNSISPLKRKKRVKKAKDAEKELMYIVSALLSLKSSKNRSKIHHDQEMKPKVKKTLSLSAINSKNNVKYAGKERGSSYNYRNYWENKKIRVSADELDKADNFSWRSNGSKKLVGLSHFRRYYRCNQKGCSVHKIVDHDTNDPSMLIICYNGEHNHTIP